MPSVVASLPQEPMPGVQSVTTVPANPLLELIQQPGVIEATLALSAIAVAVFVWWRLAALMQSASARQALSDYLLGVEQALQHDLAGAKKRLERVLAQDPENHYARLLLGKVLGELGHTEQAHQQHLYLKKAFAVDSGENDLMLARSLLAAGMPEEAADVAESAANRLPKPLQGWQFVYRARLQSGDHAAAAQAGRSVLKLLRDPDERRAFARDLARTLACAATDSWRRRDERTAQRLLREAQDHDAETPRLPLLQARLSALRDGAAATAHGLLGASQELVERPRRELTTSGESRELTVVPTDEAVRLPAVPGAAVSDASALPMATFAGLLEPTRWSCVACDAPLPRELGQCPRCGRDRPATLLEPALVDALSAPGATMDRIEANDLHVRRLVEELERGDATARGELLDLRERAVPELLRFAWKQGEPARTAVVELLREMGPTIAPVLFEASDGLVQQRLLKVGEGPSAVVGRVVQGFDREALPHLEPLFASARPDHRRVLIDYYLGLGDIHAFETVLRRFPPMEILHRCNNAEPAVLRRFLCAIPRGHFVAESLLCEPTFYRDDELLAAVGDAGDPEVLVAVMLARGPTRALVTALIRGCDDPHLCATSQRVLLEFGPRVLEHVLQAYASPDATPEARKRLARVLCLGGAEAAEHIADSFGPEPTLFDDELRHLLVVIGDEAIDKMLAAYERSGWLEKVSAGLLRRHNNRRVQLATALGELATRPAIKALQQLLKRERDDNLRLHLSRVLHGKEGVDG